MFSCCCNCHQTDQEIVENDKVELAFRRMDINNDGFVTYSEFKKVIYWIYWENYIFICSMWAMKQRKNV